MTGIRDGGHAVAYRRAWTGSAFFVTTPSRRLAWPVRRYLTLETLARVIDYSTIVVTQAWPPSSALRRHARGNCLSGGRARQITPAESRHKGTDAVYKKILIATDGSDLADRALDHGLACQRRSKSRPMVECALRLGHVRPPVLIGPGRFFPRTARGSGSRAPNAAAWCCR